MQNFGGHIFQVATPDFKVQTVYLTGKYCEKIPLITPGFRAYAINSVVFDYKGHDTCLILDSCACTSQTVNHSSKTKLERVHA